MKTPHEGIAFYDQRCNCSGQYKGLDQVAQQMAL